MMKRHGQVVSEARKARHYGKPSRAKRDESKRRAAVVFMLEQLSMKTPEERMRENNAARKLYEVRHTKPPKKKGKRT